MEYTLFTFPNCEKCTKVKEYLKEKGIKYNEINAGIGEGRVKFRDFYSKNKEQIKREDGGGITLPILSNDKEMVYQGIEGVVMNF